MRAAIDVQDVTRNGRGVGQVQRAGGSAVHRAHVLVALPAGRAFRCRLVDPLQVLAREGDPERGHVLLQVLAALGAGDGDDALLGREPRQSQLGRRHVLRGGDLLHAIHELQVRNRSRGGSIAALV